MNHYGNGYPPGNLPPRPQQAGGYPQQAQAHAYAQPAPAPYAPAAPMGWPRQAVQPYPQAPQPYSQPQPQPQAAPPAQQDAPGLSLGLGGFGVGIPGVGGLGNVNTAGLNKRAGSMSPAMVFVFFGAAIAIGFLFDVVFTFVHVPFGRYIWYATTILPFALAGMLGALWTRSGKTMVFAVAVVASLIYGMCDIGLGVALGAGEEGLSLGYIINLAAFSVGISLAGGIGGTIRGAQQKASVSG